VTITIRQLTCLRCSYAWFPRSTTKPKRCARCRSPHWRTKARPYQRRDAATTRTTEFVRREEDWRPQSKLAGPESESIEQQVRAAQARSQRPRKTTRAPPK
jgi:hypothetical protein